MRRAMIRTAIFGMALLLSVGQALSQTSTQSCLIRTIPIAILNDKGEVPLDLTSSSLSLKMGRATAKINDLRLDSGPKRVALVLDTSGSMNSGNYNGAEKIRLATKVVGDALTYLPDSISLGLITFDVTVHGKLAFSLSRQQLTAEIVDLQQRATKLPRGETALLDAVETALDTIPNPSPGDVIFGITDGEDNSSHVRRKKLEHRLQQVGVRLFLFLLRDYPNTLYEPATEDIEQLAAATGGSVLSVRANVRGSMLSGHTSDFQLTAGQLRAVDKDVHVMFGLIEHPYLAQVKMPEDFTSPRPLKLTFSDPKYGKSLRLTYPREIVPCH